MASQVTQWAKNPPIMQKMQETCSILGGRSHGSWGKDAMDPMATHSSILVWEIPWKRSLIGYSHTKSQTQPKQQSSMVY